MLLKLSNAGYKKLKGLVRKHSSLTGDSGHSGKALDGIRSLLARIRIGCRYLVRAVPKLATSTHCTTQILGCNGPHFLHEKLLHPCVYHLFNNSFELPRLYC